MASAVGWGSVAVPGTTSASLNIVNGTDAGAVWDPAENDLIILHGSSQSTVAAPAADPAGWVNLVSVGFEINGTAHGALGFYHYVTAGEAAASTTAYAPVIFGGVETGTISGIVIRGAHTSTPIHKQAQLASASATPFIIPALTGANQPTVSGCLVVGMIVSDTTLSTYTQPSGWTARTSIATNQGKWLGTRDTTTTAGVDVAATNITPSLGADESIGWTIAILDAPAAATFPPSMARSRRLHELLAR
jgi:hypothetical protein